MTNLSFPALYEAAGEMHDIERLTEYFYDRVLSDPLLAPMIAGVPGDLSKHVADFIANVFGDLDDRYETRGGHSHVLVRHLGLRVTLEQRRRWMDLLLESAEGIGFPVEREDCFALIAYLEWGSRIAVPRPQPGAAFVMTC